MREQTLSEVLASLTAEGELYIRLEDNAVRCLACGHRCLIKENRSGICQVRFNAGGRLRVPWGYVAALNTDPVEKKPFFHVLPGANTLTFGMLGCDYHCGYCFTGDTRVVTAQGPIALSELFASAPQSLQTPGAEIAYPCDQQAVAGSGALRRIRGVFKHAYRGKLAVIRPYYLPALRCTPDHRVYATLDASQAPQLVRARDLTKGHLLAIPRLEDGSRETPEPQVIDVAQVLQDHRITYHARWSLSPEARRAIAALTEHGQTSREIGLELGKSASYVRHVRSKLARGRASGIFTSGPVVDGGTIRCPNEHRPGLPLSVALDEDFAELLGLYCAEGTVVSSKKRPNSHMLSFSFGQGESMLVRRVIELLDRTLGVRSRQVLRSTTLAAVASKASAALLFKSLAGAHAAEKRVPAQVLDAPRPVAKAFLRAYVQGDGHRYANGKVSVTTVSPALAYGVAWLVLKTGYLPSLYASEMSASSTIQSRIVNRAPHQFSIVWYEDASPPRKVLESPKFFLVPLRGVDLVDYDGDVYNMEVEEEHNYLAGFFLVSNCQNWLTSQTLRDEHAGITPQLGTPQQIVAVGKRQGARLIASSYNEPLITSEWARAVFAEAREQGLRCAYVSNGNLTQEVLDYIGPSLAAYKIDLKTMNDKHYRRLGGVLQNVLDGIALVHRAGLWLEIVTLLVPGFNDDPGELRAAAEYLAALSPDIPWHVTAFHKDYRMRDPENTQARHLMRAAEIGQAAGLRFVYCGNLPGQVERYENTYCPQCNHLLVARHGYQILLDQLSGSGHCPHCRTAIPGIWV